MQSLVQRWKNKLASQNKEQEQVLPTNRLVNSLKKSHEKSKQKINGSTTAFTYGNNQSIANQPRNNKIGHSNKKSTPKKALFISKQIIINHALQTIANLVPQKLSQKIQNKVRSVIEQVWTSACQFANTAFNLNQAYEKNNAKDLIKQSGFSSSSNKPQQKLYHDLQKKYFECHKQKQYFKDRLDQIVRKYEGVQKELQRYSKMERLVDNTLAREQYMKLQHQRLKGQLQMAERRELQQQILFKREINAVKDLVQSLKATLPK